MQKRHQVGLRQSQEDTGDPWESPGTRLPQEPPLTRHEEFRLVSAAQQGDQHARERLLGAHLRLIRRMAAVYRCTSLSQDDLLQEGVLGFFRALARFQPSRDLRLSTYAVFWIRQSIGRAVNQRDSFIRFPGRKRTEARRVYAIREALRRDHGRDPDAVELSDACGVSIESVEISLRAYQHPLSLDAPGSGEAEVPFGELLADPQAVDPEQLALSAERSRQLRRALEWLTPREREVLEYRYGLNGKPTCTLDQLSRTLGCSREGIRQMELRALRRLRNSLCLWQLD
jgi:RNA polymerase sigma factor (sigma-70 family)